MYNRRLLSYLLLILVIALLFLIVLFSLGEGETFVWWGAINDGKVANFFTAVEAVCVVATLIFAVWQLEETRVSRINASKPNLRPAQTEIQWSTYRLGEIELITSGLEPRGYFVSRHVEKQTIVVKNIGSNVANDIEFKWVYKSAEVINVLKADYRAAHISNTEYNSSFSAAVLEPGKDVSIPLSSLYFLMWSNPEERLNRIYRSKFPDMILEISCRDIAENVHKTRFSVRVNETSSDKFEINFAKVSS